ncbi:enamine deaminase RidA (YjgF/YER057c/UK114 family) [Advenella incenata]|jgi:enamine deaminase RidA (YjgF/YER057c/UK114 family)|uniref:Enamine deaminase RidA (YjgF/YER057c/UK114 family) n=1 Tax=Advenella incenata TaxID=267800 RepID=A0A4Q7VRP4_9BURK|nr:RidA family protein [Advenella incenata]RZT99196.1 enamine deaminase RidA (YjgF/YER057c/UK114 family) [Advenella incenata]
MIETVKSSIVNHPDTPISNAVLAGMMVYTVQVPRDPDTFGPSGDGDIWHQADRVFSQLAHVLECAGSDMRHVAQMTIYLVNQDDAAGMNEVYKHYFPTAPYPNRATVVVKQLLGPNCLIEIVVQAMRKQVAA